MVKILSIEDSDFERKYILDLLRKNGYEELFEASTGEKGIEEYKKNRPDLVLMDLRLPGIDGLETFKKLKEINPLVKVIFVSVVTRKESVDAAKQMGVKNYVYKPITEEKLISAVKAA